MPTFDFPVFPIWSSSLSSTSRAACRPLRTVVGGGRGGAANSIPTRGIASECHRAAATTLDDKVHWQSSRPSSKGTLRRFYVATVT
jgi:hypothetical protein